MKAPATATPVANPWTHGSFMKSLTPSPTTMTRPNQPHYEGPDRRCPEAKTFLSSTVTSEPSTSHTSKSNTTHMTISLA